MNMFKKNGGFTLVELIVVIAILAILAGITVPAYSNYVEKAQNTVDSYESVIEEHKNEMDEILNDIPTIAEETE